MIGENVQQHAVGRCRIELENVFGQMKTTKETIVLMMVMMVCNLENVENRPAHVSSKSSLWLYFFLNVII